MLHTRQLGLFNSIGSLLHLFLGALLGVVMFGVTAVPLPPLVVSWVSAILTVRVQEDTVCSLERCNKRLWIIEVTFEELDTLFLELYVSASPGILRTL